MQYFKKYDFVNFYVDDRFDRVTYISDVDESGRIRVDDGWYDATNTKCIRVERTIHCECNLRMTVHTVNHMITRCTKNDIDKAFKDGRVDIEKYQKCVKLRQEHGIMPIGYND